MTVFRLLLRSVLLVVLLVTACGVAAIYLAFDRRPAVERTASLTPDLIERATRILASNDPRRMRAGAVRTVAVTAGDGDLVLNYLAHRYAAGSAEARFEDGRLVVRTSVRASRFPFSPFVNVEVQLVEGAAWPSIDRFRVGRLPLPAFVAEAGLKGLVATVWSADDRAAIQDAIKDVEFAESGARLVYEWGDDLADTVRATLVRPEDRGRLRAYHEALADATHVLPVGRVSLVDLLTPLFAVAAGRGGASDPVAENRAAILVLTFYVDRRSLADIVPEARNWQPPTRHAVRLNGRDDLSRHFIISAALASNTGGPFADAVGVYKEVADSKGGTGFSFDDIAADRAGSRLGELLERPERARQLQMRLAVPLTEAALMPGTADLPTLMPEAEFIRRFGGVGAPAYAAMMADIDRRVAAITLYR